MNCCAEFIPEAPTKCLMQSSCKSCSSIARAATIKKFFLNAPRPSLQCGGHKRPTRKGKRPTRKGIKLRLCELFFLCAKTRQNSNPPSLSLLIFAFLLSSSYFFIFHFIFSIIFQSLPRRSWHHALRKRPQVRGCFAVSRRYPGLKATGVCVCVFCVFVSMLYVSVCALRACAYAYACACACARACARACECL